MSELRHLFPSWGFLLQILAILHFLRRRPESYWFFIIFFGGFLGASVYILVEILPDLELVVAADRKFDYYRAAGLLADAYARTGDLQRAEPLFAEATQISTTPETLYNYASFLKTANRRDEAREWAQKILAKTRTLPRYMQRRERPWFRKGKALLKELTSSS